MTARSKVLTCSLMKKLILTAIVISSVSSGISVFAQVHVNMNNDFAGVMVTHIYAPLPGNPYFHQIGNGGKDDPPGLTSWAGFTPLGAGGVAQMLGAASYNQPESALLPGSPTYPVLGGFVQHSPGTQADVTFNTMPATTTQATLEMVAWDNSSGLYPTWTQASIAWQNGVIAAGTSGVWNEDGLTPTAPGPIIHPRSFNIYFVPEPTTAALTGMGAAAMLLFRRRK
jgi:hypothetical protein